MFAENHMVSVRQMKRLLVLDLFAGTSLILPAAVGQLGGKAGIFSIVLGAVAAGIFALFLLNTGRCYQGTYAQFCTQTLGKWGGRLYLAIYALKYFICAALLLAVFAQIVNHTFLTDMPKVVLGLALLAVCAYCTSRGLETRARLGEMLVYFIIIPVVIIIILAIPQIQLERLWPLDLLPGGQADAVQTLGGAVSQSLGAGPAQLLGGASVQTIGGAAGKAGQLGASLTLASGRADGAGGWGGFAWAAVVTFALFSVIEWLLYLRPNVRRPGKAQRGVLVSILWPALLNILILVTCIGVFSIEGMNAERWPTVILMQIVRFPGGFLSRQDGLMLAFWMAGMFVLISGCMNYGSESLKTVFPKYKKSWMIVFPGAFVFLCFLGIFLQDATAMYIRYMVMIYMPLSIALPVLLRIVNCLRKGGVNRGSDVVRRGSNGKGKARGEDTSSKNCDGKAVCDGNDARDGNNHGDQAAQSHKGHAVRGSLLLLPVLLCISFLCGCSRAVQIEDRNYVMCLGIDLEDGGDYSVSYGFPDLKALTGDGDNIHYPPVTVTGTDLDAAADAYARQASKRLDFGQLQMIVFGRRVMENPVAMADVLAYIKEHQEFTRTVLVCMADRKAEDIVNLDEDVNGSIGIYLRQMFENNSSQYQLTVGDLIIGMSLTGESQDIACVAKQKDVPELTGKETLTGFWIEAMK